ncbi:MAG TPA: mechanosensitive ion channel [Crocinitomicaceae bacterium]|nr:mechanosensitive ion channel [Crocinitomicaceae bacterium]
MPKATIADSTRKEIHDVLENSVPVKEFLGLNINEIIVETIKIGINILIAGLIIFVGFWLAKLASKAITRIMNRRNADAGLISFLSSGASLAIKVLIIITAINQMGIQTTSFIAVLGAAGLAVGMALQGTLSNLAGGVLILSLKPFKVGESIQVQGISGVVTQIFIFNTVLRTSDNKEITIPNSKISNENITNLSRLKLRRIETHVKLNFGENIELFSEIALKIMNEDKRIHQKPDAPTVVIESISEGALVFLIQAWTDTAINSAVLFDLNKRLYEEINKAGILFPQTSFDVKLQKPD